MDKNSLARHLEGSSRNFSNANTKCRADNCDATSPELRLPHLAVVLWLPFVLPTWMPICQPCRSRGVFCPHECLVVSSAGPLRDTLAVPHELRLPRRRVIARCGRPCRRRACAPRGVARPSARVACGASTPRRPPDGARSPRRRVCALMAQAQHFAQVGSQHAAHTTKSMRRPEDNDIRRDRHGEATRSMPTTCSPCAMTRYPRRSRLRGRPKGVTQLPNGCCGSRGSAHTLANHWPTSAMIRGIGPSLGSRDRRGSSLQGLWRAWFATFGHRETDLCLSSHVTVCMHITTCTLDPISLQRP